MTFCINCCSNAGKGYLTRKTSYFIMTVLSLQLSLAQVTPQATFSFERLSFGQTLQEVKSTLKSKTLLKNPTSLTGSIRTRTQDTTVFYEDTCFSVWVGVGLTFSKEAKRLIAVGVMYTGVDPKSGERAPNLQREVERLWNAFKNKYGERTAIEQRTPIGVELSWSHPKVTIKMLKTVVPKPGLFLQYVPPES